MGIKKVKDLPIVHGTKIVDPRYKVERYKYTVYTTKPEAQAINYILDHYLVANEETGKKQTISDVFIYALQRCYYSYWMPFYRQSKLDAIEDAKKELKRQQQNARQRKYNERQRIKREAARNIDANMKPLSEQETPIL